MTFDHIDLIKVDTGFGETDRDPSIIIENDDHYTLTIAYSSIFLEEMNIDSFKGAALHIHNSQINVSKARNIILISMLKCGRAIDLSVVNNTFTGSEQNSKWQIFSMTGYGRFEMKGNTFIDFEWPFDSATTALA